MLNHFGKALLLGACEIQTAKKEFQKAGTGLGTGLSNGGGYSENGLSSE